MPEIAPQLAELLTRWTVRLAVAGYLVRVAIDVGIFTRLETRHSNEVARWVWTIGCVFYLLHVICAFEFVHDWSHQNAFEHTAAQTETLTGIQSGAGLYFNYAFTLIWLFDLITWWNGDAVTPYDRRSYFWSVHGIFAFMVFNATVVFGPPVWRSVGLIVGAIFAIIYFWARRRKASPS
ncbi:MAG: hypothetical protein H8E66_22980 [Planctomycetes bacterium]|nr:hypothetical protein [Planctomycetota bacterium]